MKNKIFLSLAVILAGLNQSYAQCDPPKINSFEPNTGFIGSTVTITGANFDPIAANNQVYFGAAVATVQTASFGVLTVTVPTGATTAPISVKNGCNRVGYSSTAFNGIFCPTPMVANNTQGTGGTYQNVALTLTGVYGAYNMLAQDIDMDGKADIVVEGQGSGVTIARNTSTPGNLSFTAHNFAVSGANSVAVADFDGDGKRDVFVTQNVLRNTSTPGSVSFAPAVNVGTFGYQIATGDINGDGKIDLIGDNGGATMYVRLNTSTGVGSIQFAAAQVVVAVNAAQQRSTGLQAADVDGDGKVDIIGTQGGGNRAITIRNTTPAGSSTISFETPEFWTTVGSSGASYPYRCQLGDFDKDGKIDLTTCNYQGVTNTAILRNTSVVGDISLAAPINLPAPGGNYRIGVGDVNGDGYADIVTKSLSVNVFSVYQNTSTAPGTITFGTRYDYTSSYQAEVSGIAIGDLDGDFVPDIATSGSSSNRLLFHRNTSASVDNTPPTALCKNVTVALSPSGSVTVTPSMIDNGSGDACGLAPLKINGVSSVSYTCSDIGPNNAILTVTDIKGNAATCTSVVTVAPAAIIVAGQTTVCQGQTVPMNANSGTSYQWQKNGLDISGATAQSYTATESGQYTVTVTNPSPGCSGTSAATNVTVNNNPTVSTTPTGNSFLCPPGTLAITASTSSIYQWRNNGNDIPNATQQSYTATAAGTYSVRVIDLFGCSATSAPIVVSATAPEVNITGNSQSIADGDNSPSLADGTDFGDTYPNTAVTKTFVIDNTAGANALTVTDIPVSGDDADKFVVSGITLPATVAAGNTASFNVTFTGASIATYNALVTVNNNDCNEAAYDFAVTADISCVIPSFTVCPSNMYVSTTSTSCNTVVNYMTSVTGIPAPAVTYTLNGATAGSGSGSGSGLTFNKGETTVTVTATSSCGTAQCSFIVTVNDEVSPAMLAKNINAYLDASGNVTVSTAQVDNGSSDNCGTLDLRFVKTALATGTICGTANEGGTVTLNAVPGSLISGINFASYGLPNGSCGNFTIGGCHAPNSTAVVANLAIGQQSVSIPANNNTFGDPCFGIGKRLYIQATWQATTTAFLPSLAFNCSNLGANTVTLQGRDGSLNTASTTATITVLDTIKPVLTIPSNITVNCNGSTATAVTGMATATDNCGAIVNYTDLSTQSANVNSAAHYNYTITRTWTAKDVSNNAVSATQIITVQDVTKPGITVPANATVNCQDDNTPAANGTATGTDNCSPVAITHSDVSTQNPSNTNAAHYNYTITRTWTATDVTGNATSADQIITVQDVTNPGITIPQNVTVNCQDETAPGAQGTATGTDNCSPVAITYSDASTQNASNTNAGHYNYVITRTWTATDATGNSTSADQVITVQDVTNPGLTVPANTTVNCQDDNTPAANGTATGTDNCSPVTITFSDASTKNASNTNAGHYNYVITRTWTATDVTGNSTSADQVITVQDVTNPGITVPQSVTVNCQDDKSTETNGTATGTDNCSPVTITSSDVSTQNPSNTSAAHYNYTITRTWTATDVTGNSTSADQVITVQDITAPSISCPANATVSCKTSVADNGTATGTDNCSPVTITSTDASTQNGNPASSGHYNYTITRTWKATDVSGNFTTCDQVITVNALNTAAVTVSPVNTINAKHQNHTIYLGYGPQSVTLAATAQSGVGAYTYSWSPVTGVANPTSGAAVVSPLVSTTYIVTITDATGCSITKSMPVQVIDVRCGNKIQICHYPPGNTGNPQQLCLPSSAIAAHLAHGCILGNCPQNKNGEYNDGEEDNHGVDAMVVTEVKVYPNPNTGAFTVELPAGMEQSEVVIMDMAGKVIQKQTALEGNKLQFDLGPVARGIYMLHLTNDSQNFRTRISVQ